MRTIPEVRNEMFDFAGELQELGLWDLAAKIDGWAQDLFRRAPIRRAPSKDYVRPDPEALRAYAEAHPDLTYMEIAGAFGCSTGRVSEALAGFRAEAW